MGQIPDALTALTRGSPKDITRLLVAAILSSDEDMLSVTPERMRDAVGYRLVTTVGDDGTITMIVEPKP